MWGLRNSLFFAVFVIFAVFRQCPSDTLFDLFMWGLRNSLFFAVFVIFAVFSSILYAFRTCILTHFSRGQRILLFFAVFAVSQLRAIQEIESWLKLASYFFEKTDTLFVLDDCATSKDVKGHTSQLVNLGFSAGHDGISVWVLTQQITTIAKPFRENVAAIVLFYTPSGKTTKAIFDNYACEITHDEYKDLIAWLKERKFFHLVFSLCHPYGLEAKIKKKRNIHIYTHHGYSNQASQAIYVFTAFR